MVDPIVTVQKKDTLASCTGKTDIAGARGPKAWPIKTNEPTILLNIVFNEICRLIR